MAETAFTNDQQINGGNDERKLKYLEFVNAAALHAFFCFSNLYGFAKEKAGPLKPGFESVENAVKTVVSPVYELYHDVPVELLKFVDDKVDESVAKLDNTLPPLVKQVSSQAYSVAVKAPEVARGVASEVQRAGLKDTASGIAKNIYTKYEPTAKVLYNKYEPVAEHYAVSAWQSLNRLPLFPEVAQVVVPTAALCSEKYNQSVMVGAERGYRVANYLPLVPTEKIAKVFGASEDEVQPVVNENSATVSAY